MELTQTISIRGETLHLLPEKAIHWPARETLLVADTHFGKAATFRNFGIPVPDTTHATLERLSRVIRQVSVRRLIVLGDFIHSNIKDSAGFEALLHEWREAHHELEIVLLRGNHDRGRKDLFDHLRIRVKESWSESPFEFTHAPESLKDIELYGLSGHIHPQISLQEGRRKLKLPCFLFKDNHGIMPAFGDFTGCATVSCKPTDRVFLVADRSVIHWGRRPMS